MSTPATSRVATKHAELEERYAQEREKRLRDDGPAQYMKLKDTEFADLDQDLFVDYEKSARRSASVKEGDTEKVVIIGAGHCGLLFAARLIEAGFSAQEILLIDNAGGFGGTWYWNRYPGLMCDVESYIYLPLLEELNYMPKHKYAYGGEIRNHSEAIAAKYKLRPLFCTKVNALRWEQTEARWHMTLSRKFSQNGADIPLNIKAQFVLSAGGWFNLIKAPSLPGLDEFRKSKPVFHTSRWNYEVSGGSQEKPDLVNLKGKRVAIVGTGATSVQAVPELGKWADEVYVFQRTPSYVGKRGQRSTDTEAWKEIAGKKGWQQARMDNFTSYLTDNPEPVDLVNDGWTDCRAFAGLVGGQGKAVVTPESVDKHVSYFFDLDVERAEKIRDLIGSTVEDPTTAEALKAYYPVWCKRPTFHDEYLQAFNKPNMHLVDTEGKGIERYTEKGLVVNGKEYEVDCLILGTGFDANGVYSCAHRLGMSIIGRDGANLDEKWNGIDFGTLHGIMTNGFPNLFFQGTLQIPTSPNLTSIYNSIAKQIAFVITQLTSDIPNPDNVIIEVPLDIEQEWNQENAKRTMWYATLPACTPGYFNLESPHQIPKVTPEHTFLAKRNLWADGLLGYEEELAKFKNEGKVRQLLVAS